MSGMESDRRVRDLGPERVRISDDRRRICIGRGGGGVWLGGLGEGWRSGEGVSGLLVWRSGSRGSAVLCMGGWGW